MRLITIGLVFLVAAGCSSAGKRLEFESSLSCGLDTDEVETLAEKSGAKTFGCFRPGNGPLVCSAGWGRVGYECEFDSKGTLRGYWVTRLRPLTYVELLKSENLCKTGPLELQLKLDVAN